MNASDLQHLIRLSELASAEDPERYRRTVKWFALVGYLWVVLCLLLGLILLGWVALTLMDGGRFRGYMVGAILLALSLLAAGGSALWLRLDPPAGHRVDPEQAPELFRLLRKIGKKVGGPPIHHVLVDSEFNASIVQVPQWGLMGGSNTNYLVLGLPLLMAVDPARLGSVLAHEYGHLREGHGSFSAWIYRSRMAWQRFYERLEGQRNLVSAINHKFIHWYFPRFVAKSFALARQDEYIADRVAARLMTPKVTAAALKEIVVKGDWLHREFWDSHWRKARTEALPIGPMKAMTKGLLLQPEPSFARQSLQSAWQRPSSIEDTHPGLRDRIEALDAERPFDRVAPEWSRQSALSLMGQCLPDLMQKLDDQWCKEHVTEWKEYRADLLRWQQRVEQLQTNEGRNGAADWTEMADLTFRLDPAGDAEVLYERALAASADWPEALMGLARCSATTQPERSVAWAERLHGCSPKLRYWAARHATSVLEIQQLPDPKVLTLWRQRLKDAEQIEEQVWEALTSKDWNVDLARHDLNEFELGECTAFLRRQDFIKHAWIACKLSREFPWRRCYLLLVDLSGMHEDEQQNCASWLMQSFPTPGPCLVGCTQLGMDIQKAPRGTLTALRGSDGF